jgi:malonate transporter and related proteins
MATASIILPDFSLILLGFALSRWFRYERAFWDALERLIYFVLFPALLFRSLIRMPIELNTAAPLLLTGLGTTLLGMLLSYLAKYIFSASPSLFASGFQCGFRFNTYLGLAVAGSLYGAQGIAAMALIAGAMIPPANVASVWALARHGGSNGLVELVRNPLIIATVAGIAANLAGLTLAAPTDHFLEILAAASLPMGLLAVGAGLKVMALRESPAIMGYWLTVKLLLLPVVAWFLARTLGLNGLYLATAVVFAALPTASNAFILAARMGGEGQPVAALISLGTLLSMLTMPAWIAFFGL